MVEFVLAVVGEEKLQSLADEGIVDGLAAQSALDEDRRPIADIARDHVVGQFRALDVTQGGVDGMHQVEARVDQRAVEIKDDEFYGVRIKRTADTNHESSE